MKEIFRSCNKKDFCGAVAEESKDDGMSFLNKFDDFLNQKDDLPIGQQREYAIASQQHNRHPLLTTTKHHKTSMNNLYNKHDVDQIISRLELLRPDANGKWGTMSVSQMLVHLNVSLEPALGLAHPKRKLIGRLLGPILKKIYLNEKPMVKNSRTDDSYIVTGEHDFEQTKKRAIEMVELFYRNGPEKCTDHPHPYFGKLTPQEWALLKWKHYDHHLRQFGL